jgi:hypothetical protein
MKTERQRIEQLLKLQEHLGQLTEQQLQDILSDKDMQELFEQLAFTKRAFMVNELQSHEPDVKKEWGKFASAYLDEAIVKESDTQHPLYAKEELRDLHRQSIWGWLHQKVSLIIGILMVTGISLAAIQWIGPHIMLSEQSETEHKGLSSQVNTSSQAAQSTKITEKVAPVVFENVTLENIITRIAAYYQVELEFKSDSSKELRFYFVWNQEEDLDDVVEKLNRFESLCISHVENRIIVE